MKLSMYIFSDDARKQSAFYAQALNGEILETKTFGEAPGAPEEDKDRVMHLTLKIGEQIVYMADNGKAPVSQGNGMDITLEVESEDEGRQAFEKLSQGGQVLMPFERMFWGTTFGRLVDPFGVRWQITTQP